MSDVPFGYGETELEKTFEKLRELYYGAGQEVENPFETALGKLIRKARTEKGLSRAQLAQAAQISPNSLSKYELAGEPDGQFPPLPKMANLCMVLGLDPRKALCASLPFEFQEDENDKLVCPFMDFTDFLRTLDVDESKLKMAQELLVYEVKENKALREENDRLRAQINDPDHNGPGRSKNPSDEPEVVGATSPTQPRDTED